VALAEPPPAPTNPAQDAAAALVDKQLVAPLKKAESRRSRFSRVTPAPVQRRVRVTDAAPMSDGRGKEFVRFAIDMRRSWHENAPWQNDSVVGCVYVNEREVFVRDADAYVPARSLLGKDAPARPGVCEAAPEAAVQMANAGH
jgi:hypothetical protein